MPRIRATDDHHDIRRMFWAMFDKQDRFKGKCEDCGKDLQRKDAKIHHRKYEGATVKDLQIVCNKCNTKTENKNLI